LVNLHNNREKKMNKAKMKKTLLKATELKKLIDAHKEELEELKALIKDNIEVAQELADWDVKLTDYERKTFKINDAEKNVPAKTFAKYFEPYINITPSVRLNFKPSKKSKAA
jgi:hypothetical protein